MDTLNGMALAHRRKRLVFRSWHRGTRETDLILGRFADAAIDELNEAELAEFERILDMPDPDIFAWVTGIAPVPPHADTALFTRLIAFHEKGGAAPDA
ncbi:MAG: succinate dehydrogenase assembly factor 2 [Hyphomicrobiales bacterium]|nr:succinate dehydrogenase assembly factor 2 [Hyphomicrobiales bacterium]